MAINSKDFWVLLCSSGLRTEAECHKLQERFARAVRKADDAAFTVDAVKLAKWLISERAITPYQAKVLLKGRAGPFVYGPYVLRDRVMEGRLDGCFRAVHAPTNYPVLLWFFDRSLAKDPESYAAAAAQLAEVRQVAHPCLSRTYELVEQGPYKFIVLEDLHGGSAGEALAAQSRLQPADACRVMRHVALGASMLHGQELVHGDIRTENVWIDRDGSGRLLMPPLSREPHLPAGFWISALADAKHAKAHAAEAPEAYADYAAPELAFAGQQVDALADVYAIGCTLYELLSGRPPFSGGSIAEKMKRHATEAIKPLEPLRVPAELAKVVAFAMAKDRKLRYQNAADLAEALAYFLDAEQRDAMPQPVADPARRAAFEATQGAARGGDEVRGIASGPAAAKVPGDDTPAQLAYVATMQEVVSPTAVVRARRMRSRNKVVFAVALLLALCVGGGVGYVMSNRANSLAQPGELDGGDHDGSVNGDANEEDQGTGEEDGEEATADNNGTSLALWASPTAGEPLSWAYLPPRAEVVLTLRPAQLLRHTEGQKLVSALGPHGARAWAAAEAAIGMSLAELDRLTVAWTNGGGEWNAAYLVQPTAETTIETLKAKWRDFRPTPKDDEEYFIDGERAYYAPASEQGKLFLVADAAQMPELIAAGKESTPLWREMVKLLQTGDRERLCTLLFTKHAMVVGAEPQFATLGLEELHAAIAGLFPEDYRGASLSLHLDAHCYLEARLIPNPQTTTSEQLATTLHERMVQMPLDVEEYVSQIGLDPYGGRVLIRLGTMARFVAEQVRVGAEDDQVVLNCYLPVVAAHNLALGVELAVLQQRGGRAGTDSSVPPREGPKSVAQRLQSAITIVQTGDTLERALQTISAEIGVPIEILGADFVSEGITRNNRFDLDIHNTPAAEALRAVLLKASPQGKLVYVAKPKSPGGDEVVFVTTRAAAQRRGDLLPPEFAGP